MEALMAKYSYLEKEKEKIKLENKIQTMENKIPNESAIKNVVDLSNVCNDELNISKSISQIRSKYYDSELHQREKENIQNFDKQDSVMLHHEQELNGSINSISSISDKNPNFASKHLSGSINSRYTDNLLEDVDYEIRSSNNSKRIMTDRKSFVAEVGKHGKKIEQNSISHKEGDGQKDCIEGLQVVDYEDEGSIFSQQTQQINQKQSIFTPSVEQKSMNYNIKPIVYQKAKENGVEKYGVIVYDTNKISKSAMSSKKLLDNQKEQHVLDENTANANKVNLKDSQQPEMKYKVLQTNVVDCGDNAKNNKRIVLEQSSNDNINMGELGRLLIGDVRDPISKQNRPKTGTVVRQLQSYSNDTNILFQSRKSASNGSRIANVYVN